MKKMKTHAGGPTSDGCVNVSGRSTSKVLSPRATSLLAGQRFHNYLPSRYWLQRTTRDPRSSSFDFSITFIFLFILLLSYHINKNIGQHNWQRIGTFDRKRVGSIPTLNI